MAEQKTDSVPAVQSNADGTYTLKYEGKEEVVDQTRLLQLAHLGLGGHKRMEEAAALRKTAEEERAELGQLLRDANGGDVTAYAKVISLIPDLDSETRSTLVARYQAALAQSRDAGKSASQPADGGSPGSKRGGGEKAKVSAEDLPEPLQALMGLLQTWSPEEIGSLLTSVKEDQFGRLQTQVFQELNADLDRDPLLHRILEKGGPKADKLRGVAQETLIGRIRGKERYGDRLREQVVAQVRDLVKEFGPDASGSTSLPGLGPAPGVSFTETQSDEPPAPKPTTDPKYAENVFQRMAHSWRK